MEGGMEEMLHDAIQDLGLISSGCRKRFRKCEKAHPRSLGSDVYMKLLAAISDPASNLRNLFLEEGSPRQHVATGWNTSSLKLLAASGSGAPVCKLFLLAKSIPTAVSRSFARCQRMDNRTTSICDEVVKHDLRRGRVCMNDEACCEQA